MPANSDLSKISEELERRIAKNTLEVPMLPKVAGNVVRLTQDPDSEAADLSKLIQSDQSLAGNVMRVANSATYSPNNSMVSLQQAIARLGMKLIAEIALSASVNTRLFNTPGFEAHIAYELKYSLAAGLWAKEVARACRKNVEAAFLAGLLHDIGRPVVIQSVLEIIEDMKLQATKDEILLLEKNFQQQVGLRVVERWEMPSSVCHSVKYFHNYSEPHSAQMQTMIVVAGALVAGHLMFEEQDAEKSIPLDSLKQHSVFGDLNLYPDQVDELLQQADKVNSTVEVMSS